MIPILYAKLIGAGLVAIALSYGCYRLYDAGRDSIQVRWDAEKAVQQAALRAATEATERVENERKKLVKEIDETLKPKLAAVTAESRSLARRLSLAARPSAVPEAPESTPIIDGASRGGGQSCGFGDGVGEALENHFGASARDSARLNAWIEFYRQLQESDTFR